MASPDQRKHLAQKYKEASSRFRTQFLDSMQRVVGPELLRSMTSGLESCAALLENDDSTVRSTAILVAAHLFEITHAFSNRCWTIFQSASDLGLKMAALTGFARPFGETGDRFVGERLARIVLDAGESGEVRCHAYHQLMLVTPFESPLMRQPFIPSDFVFPDSVDWEFVHSYLK